MKKLIVICVAVGLSALAWFWYARAARRIAPPVPSQAAVRVDERGLQRPAPAQAAAAVPTTATISGRVHDASSNAIAHATVCLAVSNDEVSEQQTRLPRCVVAKADGTYVHEALPPGRYQATAAAAGYLPGRFRPSGDASTAASAPNSGTLAFAEFALLAREHKSNVNIVLALGGVRLQGRVVDIGGGSVADALVWAESWTGLLPSAAATQSNSDGYFELTVPAGMQTVFASAPGYTSAEVETMAPGQATLALTPEASLRGLVVDEAGRPVAGALVAPEISDDAWRVPSVGSDITDGDGKYEIRKLPPGRYKPSARSRNGYGLAPTSVQLGLGEHAEVATIVLGPASVVSGRVVMQTNGAPCLAGFVSLQGPSGFETADISPNGASDGAFEFRGLGAGAYRAVVECRDMQPLVIERALVLTAGTDVHNLKWSVMPGASASGYVKTTDGAPVADASVWWKPKGQLAGDKQGASDAQGRYRIDGLAPGTYVITVSTEAGYQADEVERVIADGSALEQDIVIAPGGALTVQVQDDQGLGVQGARLELIPIDSQAQSPASASSYNLTGVDGRVTVTGNAPGDYWVMAEQNWNTLMAPGSKAGTPAKVRVALKAKQMVTATLRVASRRGVIKGVVKNSDGTPVTDAYVVAALQASDGESGDSWRLGRARWDEGVMTDQSGQFVLTGLAPGRYSVLGYRRGGGETIARDVAVGSHVVLTLTPTASLAGTVRLPDGGPAQEFEVNIEDKNTGFSRRERFDRTNGAFELAQLPAGQFVLSASAGAGVASAKLALTAGERKANVVLQVARTVTVKGRVVDVRTHKPVPGMPMLGFSKAAGLMSGSFSLRDSSRTTDADGRFVIPDVPVGEIVTMSLTMGNNASHHDVYWVTTLATSATGVVELGELPAVARLGRRQAPGSVGFDFGPSEDWQLPTLTIATIEAGGPAAKLDLKVGDVITTIDGIDVAGARSYLAWPLLTAPPGTAIALGLARGPIVTLRVGDPD